MGGEYQKKYRDDGTLNPKWKPRKNRSHWTHPKKYLEDGTLNPEWKPRKGGIHQKKYLDDGTLNPKYQLNPGEEVKAPDTVLLERSKRSEDSFKTRFERYIRLGAEEQFAFCPLCLLRQEVEVRKLKKGEKTPRRNHYMSGITNLILSENQSVVFSCFEWIGDHHKRVVKGRKTCEECDTYDSLHNKQKWFNKQLIFLQREKQIEATKTDPIYRSVVYERDQGLCHICGKPVDPNHFHLDHVVPLALGGTHTYENIKLSHPHCNLVKNKFV